MDTKEREFAQIVLENKRRIYTVCHLFSKDADEFAIKVKSAKWTM